MADSVVLDYSFIKGKFQDISCEAQSLYIYLCATADKEGIHHCPKTIARYLGLDDSCVDELIENNFISDNLNESPLCDYKILDWTERKGTPRNSYEYSEWRRLVKERDHFRCVKCGSTQDLVVHHIKSYKDNPLLRTDLDNGITLCKRCHKEIHKDGN